MRKQEGVSIPPAKAEGRVAGREGVSQGRERRVTGGGWVDGWGLVLRQCLRQRPGPWRNILLQGCVEWGFQYFRDTRGTNPACFGQTWECARVLSLFVPGNRTCLFQSDPGMYSSTPGVYTLPANQACLFQSDSGTHSGSPTHRIYSRGTRVSSLLVPVRTGYLPRCPYKVYTLGVPGWYQGCLFRSDSGIYRGAPQRAYEYYTYVSG